MEGARWQSIGNWIHRRGAATEKAQLTLDLNWWSIKYLVVLLMHQQKQHSLYCFQFVTVKFIFKENVISNTFI